MVCMAGQAHAQATDVDCNKCVDTGDIANFAVGGGKIENGAITTNKLGDLSVTGAKIQNGTIGVSKVGPKLKNDIGTYCAPGTVVVGKANNGNFVCEGAGAQAGSNWTSYDFVTAGTNIINDCHGGPKLVKQSDFDPQLYVGAILCHPGRYKLFLSNEPDGFYWEILDSAGNGDDHCELIGGTYTTSIAQVDATQSDPGGYRRSDIGEPFIFDSNLAEYYWRAAWYECGISIPADVVFPPVPEL